jgi:hypothetical protein
MAADGAAATAFAGVLPCHCLEKTGSLALCGQNVNYSRSIVWLTPSIADYCRQSCPWRVWLAVTTPPPTLWAMAVERWRCLTVYPGGPPP